MAVQYHQCKGFEWHAFDRLTVPQPTSYCSLQNWVVNCYQLGPGLPDRYASCWSLGPGQLDTFWAYPAIIQDCGEEVKADSWVEKFALGTASSELVSRDERQNVSASYHFGLCKVRQPFLFTSLITGQFDAVRLPTSPWFLGFEMMRKIPPFLLWRLEKEE